MPTKKKGKPKRTAPPPRLENLAARPSFDEALDEQLVDHSGVFRVTSALSQAQHGAREEESSLRFASESLVMQAQQDGFRDDEPTINEAVDDKVIDDEALRAEKRARLATLAARARERNRPRR